MSQAKRPPWFWATLTFAAVYGAGLSCAFPAFTWGEHPQILIAARRLLSVEAGYGLFLSLLHLFELAGQPGLPFLSNAFSVALGGLAVTATLFLALRHGAGLAFSLLLCLCLWLYPDFRESMLWGGPYSLLWLFALTFAALSAAGFDRSGAGAPRCALAAAAAGFAGVLHHPFFLGPFLFGLIASGNRRGKRTAAPWARSLLVCALLSPLAIWAFLRPSAQYIWIPNFSGTIGEYLNLKKAGIPPMNLAWPELMKEALWGRFVFTTTVAAPLFLLAAAGAAASAWRGRFRAFNWFWGLPWAAAAYALSSSADPRLFNAAIFWSMAPLAAAGAGAISSKPWRSASLLVLAVQCAVLPAFGGWNFSAARRDSPLRLQNAMLDAAGPDALIVLLTPDDPMAGLNYLQQIEGIRKDALILKPDLFPIDSYRERLAKEDRLGAGVAKAMEEYPALLNEISTIILSRQGAVTDSPEGQARIYRGANMETLFRIVRNNLTARPVHFDRIEATLDIEGGRETDRFAYAAEPPLFSVEPVGLYVAEHEGRPVYFQLNRIPSPPPRPKKAVLERMRGDETGKKIYSAFYASSGRLLYKTASESSPPDPGFLSKALAYFKAGLSAWPDSGELLFLIGSAQNDLGRYEEAARTFERAEARLKLQIEGGDRKPDETLMLSEIYRRSGRDGEAARILERMGLDRIDVVSSGHLDLRPRTPPRPESP